MSADVLLQEATWAVQLHEQIKEQSLYRSRLPVAEAHRMASLSARNGQDRRIHELLMNHPLPRLTEVYEEIFEKVLGERVSEMGPLLAEASVHLERAKKAGRPILFVLHENDYAEEPQFPLQTQLLLNEYTLIVMPLRAAPALSQLTGQPPFETSGRSRPVIVVARSDGTQLASITGWHDLASVNEGLATGWMDALIRNPPGARELIRAERLLRKVSPEGVDWGTKLTDGLRESKKSRDESDKGFQLAAR